jgi:hypothetical protein
METPKQRLENPSPFTWEQLAACCTREAGKRRGFYPKLVTSGKMSQEAADAEIAKMDSAAEHFKALAGKPLVQYATAAQKEEIARLYNHPLITRPEKTKIITGMGQLDEEQATRLIAKLRKAIEDREGLSQAA